MALDDQGQMDIEQRGGSKKSWRQVREEGEEEGGTQCLSEWDYII